MQGKGRFAASSRHFLATSIAVLGALILSSMSPAFGRPGNPINFKATAGVGSITLSWHDTTKPGEGSCHDIEIRGPGNVNEAIDVTGGVCLKGGTDGQYVVNGINFGEQLCFRIRARDRANAEGEVSLKWAGPVCESALPPSGPGVGQLSEFMPGIDLFGSDMPASESGRTPLLVPANRPFDLNGTAAECRQLCNASRRCVAWTMVKPGVQEPSAVCYLKSQAPALVKSDCCVSGNKVLVNTDLPGGDLNHLSVPSLTYVDCENKCAENRRCSSWTYVKAGVQGSNPVCYFKGTLPEAKANNCCTSGRMR
jgi:hypothetical protein